MKTKFFSTAVTNKYDGLFTRVRDYELALLLKKAQLADIDLVKDTSDKYKTMLKKHSKMLNDKALSLYELVKQDNSKLDLIKQTVLMAFLMSKNLYVEIKTDGDIRYITTSDYIAKCMPRLAYPEKQITKSEDTVEDLTNGVIKVLELTLSDRYNYTTSFDFKESTIDLKAKSIILPISVIDKYRCVFSSMLYKSPCRITLKDGSSEIYDSLIGRSACNLKLVHNSKEFYDFKSTSDVYFDYKTLNFKLISYYPHATIEESKVYLFDITKIEPVAF